MNNLNEETYQIATLVAVVVTVLVCMCYFLIFVNPQIALNPLKPSTATATVVVLAFQPTWTQTATVTPSPTETPTLTPTETATPLPTDTATSTPRIPTPTNTRPRPTLAPRPPAAPTSTFAYHPSKQGCFHSGGTYIEGVVKFPNGTEQAGMNIAMGSGPGPGTGDVFHVTTGAQGKSAGYYLFVIRANGAAPGNYWVWVDDGSGRALSDPRAAQVTTNDNRNPGDPSACWRAVVDFIHR